MNLNYRFAGIFPHDKLTTDIINSSRNKLFILNLDYSTSNGTYWVCVYYNGKRLNILIVMV